MVRPADADFLVERPQGTHRTVGAVDDIVPSTSVPPENPLSAREEAVEPVEGAPAPTTVIPAIDARTADLAAQEVAARAALDLFANMREPAADSAAGQRRTKRVQFVDADVTRAKFDRQVAAFRRHEDAYRQRGCILIDATFPKVFAIQCVPQLRPQAILLAVIIDYTNFDAEPPSVSIVDPFTMRPLTMKEVWPMPRRGGPIVAKPQAESDRALAAEGAAGELQMEVATVMQAWSPDDIPFLCVPGVLEYHEHPGHSGDGWLRHRALGAGSLDAILNLLHTFGTAPVMDYTVSISARQLQDGSTEISGKVAGFSLKYLPK